MVKTEVFGRAFKAEDMQKAVEDIEKNPLLPDDIGDTVLFVLSAPPRMEVIKWYFIFLPLTIAL